VGVADPSLGIQSPVRNKPWPALSQQIQDGAEYAKTHS
jgi:hypothetical protein